MIITIIPVNFMFDSGVMCKEKLEASHSEGWNSWLCLIVCWFFCLFSIKSILEGMIFLVFVVLFLYWLYITITPVTLSD